MNSATDFRENHVPRKRCTRVGRDGELKHCAVAFFFFSVFTTEGCNPENLTVQVSDIPCGGCVRPSRSPEQAALGGGVLTTTPGPGLAEPVAFAAPGAAPRASGGRSNEGR